MEQYDEVALMRYQLISPLLDPDLKRGERSVLLRNLAKKRIEHPNTKELVKFQAETIRHWVKQYRKNGFSGLCSKLRSDKDTVKAIPTEVAAEAINLKLENPSRTIDGIISILETSGKIEAGIIKRSTLHRLFQKRKINIRKLKPSAVFGRFEAELPNDLWQSDLLFGPKLPDTNRPGKFFTAQLYAFIDDHSRIIPHGQFYHHSRTSHLEHCFRKSLQKRGVPKVVYVDNGAVYKSNQLASICAHLGIRLKFTKPYSPEGKGKIEKFFSYVRSSFLTEVESGNIQTLEQLNQAFWAWLEVHYHRRIHGSTKQSPLERFSTHLDKIKFADERELYTAFLIKENKKIHKDRTFQLKNRYYEVLPALVNQETSVFYDPDNLDEVRVYLAGEFFQVAKPIRLHSKAAPKIQLPLPTPVKTDFNHLAELVQKHTKIKDDLILGPEIVPVPNDNRFTKRDFLEILKKAGFHLDKFEEKEIKSFFDQFGSINNSFAKKCLKITIEQVGIQKHISFYLDILKGGIQNA
ncbi:DDE-type integrase/transposase/recombinase [Candidatus Margulisiibacteriota bacterium]